MAQITVNMNLKTRPAIYTPCVDRPQFGLRAYEQYNVDVFGIYQVAVDSDIDAYFVITLPGGRCTYAGVEQIKFTDVAQDGEVHDNA